MTVLFQVNGINRNIVECKDSSFSTRKRSVCSINRNIVECKDKGRTETH